MAENREEVLADFQACTGIEDVGECIFHLEEANWNLLDAINRVMPQETQTLPSELTPSGMLSVDLSSEPMEVAVLPNEIGTSVSSLPQSVSLNDDVIPLPSTSQSRTRLINFNVEFRDRVIPIVIPDCETVETIKTVLFSELGILQCKQDLRGWKSKKVNDQTKLSSLNLPKDNTLFLLVPDLQMATESIHNGDDPTIAERMTQTFKLNITDETNHKDYSVNYLGSKTVREVKQDVFSFTDIPARHQSWTGWPSTVIDENVTLASSGISYPCHALTVRRVPSSSGKENYKKQVIDLIGSDSSSGEEFEDASESFNIEDEMFIHDISRKIQPLMADNVENVSEALTHLATEFSNRYGECHPMFFQGSLDDALKEACFKSAKERKPLAIYLHHDGSVLTNVFCTQLLCSETIVSYLSNNFITWAWDLTYDANRASLLAMVTKHFGSVAAQTIRNYTVEQFPILLIIMRSRSSTEVFTIIHGSVSLDELMTSLIHAVDVFTSQQQIEMREEEEREAREKVKREQDLAYEASLQADRIKEEAKRVEEEERLKKEREVELEKEAQNELIKQQAAVKEAIRQSLEDTLLPEPSENTDDSTKIKFRFPAGNTVTRRFHAKEPLQNLLNFLVVEGFPTDDYKVLTSWPRRDLTTLNSQQTLKDLNLYPQETLTLEER